MTNSKPVPIKVTATKTKLGSIITVTDRHGNSKAAGLGEAETADLLLDLIKCLPDGHVLRKQYSL